MARWKPKKRSAFRQRAAAEGLDLTLLQRQLAGAFPAWAVEVVAVPSVPAEFIAGMVRATAKAKKDQQPFVVLTCVTGDSVLLFGVVDVGKMIAEGFPELFTP